MNLLVKYIHKKKYLENLININGSKSISNRLLILKKLFPNEIKFCNISSSDDTKLLINALYNNNNNNLININHAGTSMRFLTSYFSIIHKKKPIILTGSKRMQNRPILHLVNSLISIGANIKYCNKFGYPPLKIYNSNITGNIININASISSQYITSLMLIATKLKNGLIINLFNNVTSNSYIKITKKILKYFNIKCICNKNKIIVINNKTIKKNYFFIESDWSSASYYYAIVALNKYIKIKLKYYTDKDIQGDSIISNLYNKYFNVETNYNNLNKTIEIKKKKNIKNISYIKLNLIETPDIAQTIIATCVGLKIKCKISGLYTLNIKETNRLKSMKTELYKFGVISNISKEVFEILDFTNNIYKNENNVISINTYNDHRMAMSLSILSIVYKDIIIKIKNYKVVNKSYSNFWKDIEKIGFNIIYN